MQQLQAHSRNRGATDSAKLWVVLEELCSLKVIFILKDGDSLKVACAGSYYKKKAGYFKSDLITLLLSNSL